MSQKILSIEELISQKANHFDNLMKYSINTNNKSLKEIEKFFNTLISTNLILGSETLLNIGEKFNKILNLYEDNLLNKKDLILKIMQLYARAYIEIEELNTELHAINPIIKWDYAERMGINIDNNRKILIVDDDIVTLSILEKIFIDQGYDVKLSSNPFNVISMIKDENIDLVILDMIMPKMDGIDLIKLIKSVDSRLPIIMLSGKSDSESKIKALGTGADDYVIKPFEEGELIARVEKTIVRSLKYKEETIVDWLTGAYTKSYFWKRIKECKDNFNRNGRNFSVVFIDMDNFKCINDTYGHLVGDEILKSFANVLKATLRGIDQIFRFGGDEFIVLFQDTDMIDAYNVIERFRQNVDNIIGNKKSRYNKFITSFSAGIAEVKGVEDNIENIINRADKALYAAKKHGKNRTCSYEDLSLI